MVCMVSLSAVVNEAKGEVRLLDKSHGGELGSASCFPQG
jgi:hypothetical protein